MACRDMNVLFVSLSLASVTADDYEEKPAIFCTVNAVCEYRPVQMEVAGTSQELKNVPEQGQVPKAEVDRKKLS